MNDNGSGLEQLQIARLDGGDLAKRLKSAIDGARLIFGSDQFLSIRDACLFECPAHPKIAYKALGKRRYPAKRTQSNHRRAPLLHMSLQLIERSGPATLVTVARFLIVQTRMSQGQLSAFVNCAKMEL